jgi:hypothetical protein
MDMSDACDTSLVAISLKALVEKENRPQYRIVSEGKELTKSYAIFDARSKTSSSAISLPIHSRLEAVEVLMRSVEMFGEDREIVSVAMNFLDRFVALESERFVKNGFDHEFKNSHFLNSVHQREQDEKKYCLGMFVLVSLDLAIRLYSPTSGDAFRNAVQRVADTTSIDPSATSMTLSNDIEMMGSSTTNHPSEREQSCHDLFFQEVKKEFYGDKIYHSTKFNSLRRLSNHQKVQDFGDAQSILMKRLDFYLCPVLAPTIVQYLLQSIESDLSLIDLKYDFQIETILHDYSIYQVELSSYCPSLVNIKPSIIAYSAITNAMKVFLPHVTKFLRKKMSAMCMDTLDLPIHSKETKCVGRLLFQMWKENYPASIQSLESTDMEETRTPTSCKVSFHSARVSPDTVAAVVDQPHDDIINLPCEPMIVLQDSCLEVRQGKSYGTRKRPKVSTMDDESGQYDTNVATSYSDFVPIAG